MYQIDYEPSDTAAVLTTGAIGKLANAAAEARNLISKTTATLADLERRIAYLEKNRDEHARWGRREA